MTYNNGFVDGPEDRFIFILLDLNLESKQAGFFPGIFIG